MNPDQPQHGAVVEPQHDHHQQLAAQEGAQHLVGLVCELDETGCERARNQFLELAPYQVPITQQIEAYHRDQQDVGDEGSDC